MSAFDQIRDVYFGSARAPMRLTPKARQRVLWTSVAPTVIVVAVLLYTALSIIYSPDELFGYGAPLLVRRAFTVSRVLQSLEFLPLALLFAAGLQAWTRAEASWMILIGTALAAISIVCGAFVVGAFAVLDPDDVDDVRADLWMNIASSFALMAIGYFFLAYRGASGPAGPPRKMPRAT